MKHLSLALIFGLLACGRTLPTELTNNKPTGSDVEKVDLSLIHFSDILTEETVNLKTYMQDKKLTHMLLTFGSQSCAACMEKTRYFQQELVGKYELLLGPSGSKFEVRGVNVDKASNHNSVVQLVKSENLTHLAWSDAEQKMMLGYFQPSGMAFSVPLTVMLNEHGIMWRISSKEHATPQEIIQKVAASLGQDVGPLPPSKKDPGKPIVLSALADERPDRLSALQISACDGTDIQTAESTFDGVGLKFVLADRGTCAPGSICAQNKVAIESFLPECVGKTCKLLTVAQKADKDSAACTSGLMKGGAEVFEIFKDHFNARYSKDFASDGATFLPEVAGPVVLAFDAAGKLVFSKEGVVTAQDLTSRWSADQLTARAPGPAFPTYDNLGTSDFSKWRSKAKWTVVVFFGRTCSGCLVELEGFHKAGGLIEYCEARPDFCQVKALEFGFDWDGESASLPGYYNAVQSEFKARSWRVPLLMDPITFSEEPNYRWFDNWVIGRFGFDPRAVLYDIEGKVRGNWLSVPSETGPLDMLKELNQR